MADGFLARVLQKLPYRSGSSLTALRNDQTFVASVSALIDLAQYRPSDICAALINELDTVSARSSKLADTAVSLIEDTQLFVLRLILCCLAHSWAHQRRAATTAAASPSAAIKTSKPISDAPHQRRTRHISDEQHERRSATTTTGKPISDAPTSNSPQPLFHPRHDDDVDNDDNDDLDPDPQWRLPAFVSVLRRPSSATTSNTGSATPSGRTSFSSTTDATGPLAAASMPDPIPDPLELDDSVARFMLSVASRFFQIAPINVLASTLNQLPTGRDLSSTSSTTTVIANSDSDGSFGPVGLLAGTASPAGLITAEQNIMAFFKGNYTAGLYSATTGHAAQAEVTRIAGRIVFYLSASNWFVVFASMKSRLQAFHSLARNDDSSNVDMVVARLFEWSNFNRARLSMLLPEISLHLPNCPRLVQQLITVVLRRSIWNWIESHPLELIALHTSHSRIDGGPEVLFDILSASADALSSKKRPMYWPTQMMLLILAPDIITAMATKISPAARQTLASSQSSSTTAMIVPGNVVTAKISWLDSVKQNFGAKAFDLGFSVQCYVDICRVLSFLPRSDGLALRYLVPDIENLVMGRVFVQKAMNPLQYGPSSSIGFEYESGATQQFLMECLTSVYRLNAAGTYPFIAKILKTPSTLSRSFTFRCCLEVMADESRLPWNLGIDVSLSGPMRSLFEQYCSLVRKNWKAAQGAQTPAQTRGAKDGGGGGGGSGAAAGGRSLVDSVADNMENCALILNIWIKSPFFVIANGTSALSIGEIVSIFSVICNTFIEFPNRYIRTTAAKCLRILMAPNFVQYWDGTVADIRHHGGGGGGGDGGGLTDPFTALVADTQAVIMFWQVSSQLLLLLSRSLIESPSTAATTTTTTTPSATAANLTSTAVAAATDDVNHRYTLMSFENVKTILTLLRDLLVMRTAHIRHLKRRIIAARRLTHNGTVNPLSDRFLMPGIDIPERIAALVSVEIALLVLLCSSDVEITALAISCLGCLVDEMELTGEAAAKDDYEMMQPQQRIDPAATPILSPRPLVLPTNSQFRDEPSSDNNGSVAVSSHQPPPNIITNVARHGTAISSAGAATGGGATPSVRAPHSILQNISVYRDLRALVEGDSFKVGQRAQQKRIRRLLSSSPRRPTAGTMGAWEEVYGRWRVLSQVLGSRSATSLTATSLQAGGGVASNASVGGGASGGGGGNVFMQENADWQNFTGFLCALGGVCWQSMEAVDPLSGIEQDPPGSAVDRQSISERNSLGFVDQPPLLPRSTTIVVSARRTVERFTTDLINLLVCDNIFVREAVKEFLGNELNPLLYDFLLSHYENIITRFVTATEMPSIERNILFIESCIWTLRSILERTDETVAAFGSAAVVIPADTAEVDNTFRRGILSVTTPRVETPQQQQQQQQPFSDGIDFGTIVISLFKFVNRLSMAVPRPTSMRVQLRMCQLVEVVVLKREVIGLRQDVRLRNLLVDALMDWNAGLQEIELYKNIENKNSKIMWDLDIGSMRAISCVLSGLPLRPSAEIIVSVTTSVSPATDDSDLFDAEKRAREKLFGNYLDFFHGALEKIKNLEQVFFTKRELQNQSDALYAKSKEALIDLTLLKENTIQALSNLLSANMDIGIKYSLSMGYNQDLKIRAAFMQVLTNLLDSDASQHFTSLGEDGALMRARYQKLVDIVVRDDLAVALALGEVAETDDACGAMIAVFQSEGKLAALLEGAIENEVASTENAVDLFRRNSFATRLLTNMARNTGRRYLVTTLRPVLNEILAFDPPLTFEVDPVKMTPTDEQSVNIKNLKMLIRRLLESIMSTIDIFPRPLREICAYISRAAVAKFPDAKLMAVGSFVFLRFLCPVLVAPESMDIVLPIKSKDVRRGLVLATKVIQKLANNVLFGPKEKFMEDLNETLRKNISKVNMFLETVSSDMGAVETTTDDLNKKLSAYDLRRLHRVLSIHFDGIDAVLNTRGRGIDHVVKRSIVRQLSSALSELGPGPDVSTLQQLLVSKDQATALSGMDDKLTASEFIERCMKRSGSDQIVEVLKARKFFYIKGVSMDNVPVCYYISRKVITSKVDMNLIIFYMLSVARAVEHQPFDLVLDGTFFTPDNAWDLASVTLLYELVNSKISNLRRVYLYSCNSMMVPFCQRVLNALPSLNIIYINSIRELTNYIAPAELSLPEPTIALERDVIAVFSPVDRVVNSRKPINVMLKLNAEAIQIISDEKPESGNLPAIITDIYRFSDIEEVVAAGSEGEFLIKHAGSSALGSETVSTITFRSPNRDAIVVDLRNAVSAYLRSRPQDHLLERRNLTAAEVPGPLLNMAMLNLGSEDPYLRYISYNMLDSIARVFKLEVGSHLLSAKGLCIPANNQSFVLDVSRHLAETRLDMTVEFLNEAALGLRSSSKDAQLHCLEYMGPWLQNLQVLIKKAWSQTPAAATPSADTTNNAQLVLPGKIVGLIKILIDVTIQNVDIFSVAQSKIWKPLSEVPGLLPFICDSLLQAATESGVGSPTTEILANTMITLASTDVAVVSHKLVDRIISAITCGSAVSSDSDSKSLSTMPQWTEICVLVRFLLMLSFHNQLDVARNLPRVAHIVVLLVGLGRRLIRTSVYGIVVNLAHSLCVLLHSNPSAVQKLRGIIAELSEPKVCVLFGVSGALAGGNMPGGGIAELKSSYFGAPSQAATASAFEFSTEALGGDVVHEVPYSSVEAIANILVQMLRATETENVKGWNVEWRQLAEDMLQKGSQRLRSRSYIALGALSRYSGSEAIYLETVSDLCVQLDSFNDQEVDTIICIAHCLTNMSRGLSDFCSTERLKDILINMAWLAISLIQIDRPQIFIAAVSLLNVTLRRLDAAGAFNETCFTDVMMNTRSKLQDALNELDRSLNVWFGADFALALSANLIKGLRHNSTRAQTVLLFTTLIELSSRGPQVKEAAETEEFMDKLTDFSIPFVVPMLPSAIQPSELFKLAGVPAHVVDFVFGEATWNASSAKPGSVTLLQLFPSLVADEYRAITVISVMVLLLESSESDSETRFIYKFLSECCVANPNIFALVYETIRPRIARSVPKVETADDFGPIHTIVTTLLSLKNPKIEALLSRSVSQQLDTASIEGQQTGGGGTSTSSGRRAGSRSGLNKTRSGSNAASLVYSTESVAGDSFDAETSSQTGTIASRNSKLLPVLADNQATVAFLEELGFKGLPSMTRFSALPPEVRISNARIAAIAGRMMLDALGHSH